MGVHTLAVPTNIKTLLAGNAVEWARIEFKETWDAEASLKTICAFANDIDNWGGGYLVIGVEEKDGRPVHPLKGVPADIVDGYLKDMLNKCKRIQPEYLPIVEVVDYQDKKFIVVWAPGGYLRPYSSPKSMAKEEKERVCYIRKMSSTIMPSEEEKRDLYNLANNVPFDDRVNHEADIVDLNLTLIQAYLKEVESSLYEESKHMDFLDLCRNMNIVNTLPEYTKPKNVGLMFFSLEPDRFFPYAQIDVVQFPEDLGGNQIIEKTFKGPLHQQLREALQYIRNSVIQEQVIKFPDRAEAERFFNYPYAAIEESLCNAVYHKGYDVREPIEVRILPDRIEIVSHPGADRSISEEGLRTYRVFNRRYRRIGDFLKEMHLTEGRNTGFRKILNALERNGSPAPIFETDPERLSFCTTIFIHPQFLPQSGTKDGTKSGTKKAVPNCRGERVQLILSAIQENPQVTVRTLVENFSISKNTILRILKELQENGTIKREGSSRKGRWVVL